MMQDKSQNLNIVGQMLDFFVFVHSKYKCIIFYENIAQQFEQDQTNLDLWPREKTKFCNKRLYKTIKRP